MNLNDFRRTWDTLGEMDPLWAVLSNPDKKGRRWNTEEFFATGLRQIETLIHELRSLNRALGRRSALDFGCGVGRLTQPLTRHFDEVIGVDLSPEMVRIARAHNRTPERCRYVVNASSHLAMFPSGSFDLVLSFLTLQHIPPRYSTRYLREFVRIARTGGMICVQLPAAPATLLAALRTPARIVNNAVRAFLARVRIGGGARMSMYGVSREMVGELFRAAGAELLEVRSADEATPRWRGYRYIAIKE